MDDAHITAINKLAAKLEERQSADELVTVRQRRKQLNNRSVSLSTSIGCSLGFTQMCFCCPGGASFMAI